MLLPSLNPYMLIAGAAGMAALIGGYVYQGHEIHKYHKAFIADEKEIVTLQVKIEQMTLAQDIQNKVSGDNVVRVVHVPGKTLTIVKTIHDAPEPANCGTPTLTQEEQDSF